MTRSALGLPPQIRACLFDLDGVLTRTPEVHAAAWKQMLDAYLLTRPGEPFVPFDPVRDYDEHVDGRDRVDGVRSFLGSRGVELPEEAVRGLANRKSELVLATIRREGVQVYDGSLRYVEAARRAGLRVGVVSSSTNCGEVLLRAGIGDLFEVRVDGVAAEREQLRPKPAPDMFIAAARALGVRPAAAAVFEDAPTGVAAARAGRFGYVVGVDRTGRADALRAAGADAVVTDLAQLLEAS